MEGEHGSLHAATVVRTIGQRLIEALGRMTEQEDGA